MRRLHLILPTLAAAALLAGCAWSQKIEGRIAPDTISLADRCGLILQAAMPFAQIELGDSTAHSPDVRTIVARATGTRGDIAPGGVGDRDLSAECTFTNDVLTAFRWTKGGPSPSPTAEGVQPPVTPDQQQGK